MNKKQRFNKGKVLTKQLPPTPCTPEMRNKIEQMAHETGRSLADLQREAMSLFLARNYSKTIVNKSKAKDRVVS